MTASPVFRIKKTVTQSDSTTLTITRVGADHVCYYVTEDNMPVWQNATGDYCYATIDNEGNVSASDVVAHEASVRTSQENAYAKASAEEFYTFIDMRNKSRYGIGSLANASVPSKGDVRIAVILAEFSDVEFQPENGIEKFHKHFNASNYKDEGGAGSVRDYFIAQSDSMFRPTFDVLTKVKLKNTCKYYGANSNGNDVRARAYIADAVDAAVANGVDFSPYKNDKGEIFVIVIYPGHGEQVSGEPETLWAAYFYSMSHTLGDLKFTSGLVMDELANYGRGEQFDGIGTLCHEFSHALGLPDFYNTNSARGIFGMDAWSIMDYGQFNNVSRTPVGYTSYEREFMGWLKIETLKNEKQYVSLAPLHTKEPNRAYRIVNPANKTGNEYYLIENRQKSDWYSSTYGEGMLVIHVDYDANSWASNTINNNSSRQRMTIIPADNMASPISSKASDYKGDLFPGYLGVQEFSQTTTPAPTVYTGGVMDIKMTKIHEISDNIEFYYQCSGILDMPKNVAVTSADATGVTISFDNVDNATKYTVVVYKDKTIVTMKTVESNQVSFDNLTPLTEYTVSVVAKADDYLDSKEACILLPYTGTISGDVNLDSVVNAADVVSIYNFITRGEESGVLKMLADVNKDNVVNAADVTQVYNIIAGN